MPTHDDQQRNDQLRKQRLEAIGYAIAVRRERKNLSQAQLARMLGYTGHAHLSRIESGKKAPSLEKLFEIADILEVDVSRFFDDV